MTEDFVIEEVGGHTLAFGVSWLKLSGPRAQRRREVGELVKSFEATHWVSRAKDEIASVGVLSAQAASLPAKTLSPGVLLARYFAEFDDRAFVIVRALRNSQQYWICAVHKGLVEEAGERLSSAAGLVQAVEEVVSSIDDDTQIELILDGVAEAELNSIGDERIVLRSGSLAILIDGQPTGEARLKSVSSRSGTVVVAAGVLAGVMLIAGLGYAAYQMLWNKPVAQPVVAAAPPPDPTYASSVVENFNNARHFPGKVLVRELDRVLKDYPVVKNGWMIASARCASGGGCQITYRRLPFAGSLPPNPAQPEGAASVDLEEGSHSWKIAADPLLFKEAPSANNLRAFLARYPGKESMLPFFWGAKDYELKLSFTSPKPVGQPVNGATFGVEELGWELSGDVFLLGHLEQLPDNAVLSEIAYKIEPNQTVTVAAKGIYWRVGAPLPVPDKGKNGNPS
ncbi:hypothetical protein SAMN06265795_117109 [Noviherbaspirillum humi]|uniref:Pilin accessory protein (PilO) n=1 Tax=Noviherbaspirillum humi TaxID=1688639 RepID=A0A239KVE4_9BURK|nr:hypothetical protein [Noviherbaspirillum humi]SNT22015.1 hypothetical protein SAMN06265795_117109 [Noviherbaspirillum humi]